MGVEWMLKENNSFKVKIEKNIEDIYADAISFNLVQAKKSMFTVTGVGSRVSDKSYWCENQLITSPEKNLFSNSFEFNELYDLADDEDFALIQDIEFRNNFLGTGSKKKYPPATKPYVNYEIIIIYSDDIYKKKKREFLYIKRERIENFFI